MSALAGFHVGPLSKDVCKRDLRLIEINPNTWRSLHETASPGITV